MPAVTEAVPTHQVEVAKLRKEDYAELKAWAEEVGVTPDQLCSQLLTMTARILLQRREVQAGDNVVPFSPRR